MLIILLFSDELPLYTRNAFCVPSNMVVGFDAEFNRRIAKLFDSIKCLPCKGESIKESKAEFANILRQFIIKEVKRGRSDKQILETLKAKYGENIALKPSFSRETVLLWILPYAILCIIILILFARYKKQMLK